MGHFGYDLKSETENLHTRFANTDGFSELYFFVPEIIVLLNGNEIRVGAIREEQLIAIDSIGEFSQVPTDSAIVLNCTTPKKEYIDTCKTLLGHIHRGDIYEVNYCVDFAGENRILNPTEIFANLSALSEAPFSALYRNSNSWLMCGSPERFLMKSGNKLISQPIKGTRRRSTDPAEDVRLKDELESDPKERSENVMIVDLVRNDLSRVAKPGSVEVTEMCGIHTFKTVHQMISTIQCELKADVNLHDIIKSTFPMGSMTGAPKISAMKLAEQYEKQSRGIYSGSVGYITPDGDFDFNVVIRSITWNADTGYVSAKTGSAITANSIPEKEYEECLIKAEAMMNALRGS